MGLKRKEQRWKYKLIIALCFLNCSLWAQSSKLEIFKLGKASTSLLFNSSINAQAFSNTSFNPTFNKNAPHLPTVYSYAKLSLFCKVDVQLKKRNKWPLKFRLGNQALVDEKEGK